MIGPNGCGKSTLLKRIASGAVQNFPAHLSVLYVQQENVGTCELGHCLWRIHDTGTGDDRTALQSVIDADEERRDLLRLEELLIAKAVRHLLELYRA